MAITPAGQAALTGIRRGMEGLQGNAAEIAQAGSSESGRIRSIAEPLVEQIRHAGQVEASVQVLRTEDRMLGALLDVKA